MKIPFLTAHWANLLVINYEIAPEEIRPFVPRGLEIDFYNNRTFISLVAFRFLQNKLFGIVPSFPAYSFDEMNLRFYVRLQTETEVRKGVTFRKEFVPSRIIAATARSDGSTSEYEVRHPRWKIWNVGALKVSENFRNLYGPEFAPALSRAPHSAFVAQGSPVSVHIGRRLKLD